MSSGGQVRISLPSALLWIPGAGYSWQHLPVDRAPPTARHCCLFSGVPFFYSKADVEAIPRFSGIAVFEMKAPRGSSWGKGGDSSQISIINAMSNYTGLWEVLEASSGRKAWGSDSRRERQ